MIKAERVHYTNGDRQVYNEIVGIKKSILFGLVLIDEILREFRDPGGFVSLSYKNIYGFVPESYKKRNLYNIVYSLKRNGEVDSFKKDNFRLSQKGKGFITDYFPRLRFLNKSWDGKWRVVGFDIEEKIPIPPQGWNSLTPAVAYKKWYWVWSARTPSLTSWV